MAKRSSSGTPFRQVALAKKRRAAEQKEARNKVALETILGITCYSGSGLSNSETCVAYPAGCVAVLFHPKGKGKQVHIRNRKPISCLCISPNGSFLATGECGHEPCVRVWDIRSATTTQVCRLKEHQYGVQCVAFSPSGKHLVSVGYQHDRQVIVWNWKAGTKLVHGKFANKVNSVAFSQDQTSKLDSAYFVTAHNRRVQFWYYNPQGREGETLKSRSAILGELQQSNFVAVCCGRGSLSHYTYGLTRAGQLCLFGRNRVVERFTEAKTSPAYSLALNDQYLFCGCTNGIIRIFDPHTLDYITTMPHPHPLGINLASMDSTERQEVDKQVHPDAIAMAIYHNQLSTVYNDHSVFVWDLSNIKQIRVVHSFLFHSAGVWDICTYPILTEDSDQLLPPSCFITCSSDATMRFWSLGANKEGAWSHQRVYSKELLRIVYSEPDEKLSLKDPSDLPGLAAVDGSKGLRCIQVRPDGRHVAAGDRMGNLMVYDLQFMDEVYREIAHDNEILSLSFSPTINNHQFLSSGSRDRMVHIFSVNPSSYEPIQSLNDHSAAVTSVQYVRATDGTLQLLSSGADKSIIFHSMSQSQEPSFHRSNNIASKATIYDMAIDAFGKHVVTAGQDRVLRFYLVNGGKQKTVIKAPSTDSDGSLLKVSLDPSGLFAATSCADKSVLIFDVFSGDCVAKLTGHSELVTQVRFSQDCKLLYSVSGDSCIFVWRLSARMTQAMHNRLSELGLPLPAGGESPPTPSFTTRETYTKIRTSTPHIPRAPLQIEPDKDEGETVNIDEPDYRMSILDAWVGPEEVVSPTEPRPLQPLPQRGRWTEGGIGDGVLAVQESESDAEVEDLSLEMGGIVFGKQHSIPEVIDLTQDDEEVSVCPVTETQDHVTDDSNDSKGSEEEIKFFITTDDVDPSIFSVTTPVKLSTNESEDDESSRDSPSDSPVPPTKAPQEDDSSFLKAHFESLEKEPEPHLLRVPSPRQSISAKFLERSLLKTQTYGYAEKAVGHSPKLTSTEAAGIFISVQDTNGKSKEEEDQTTPLALPTNQDGDKCQVQKKPSSIELFIKDDNETKPLEDPTKMKRRLSFEEALDKTKKMLKELGYSVEHKSTHTPQKADSPVRVGSPIRVGSPVHVGSPVRIGSPLHFGSPIRVGSPLHVGSPVHDNTQSPSLPRVKSEPQISKLKTRSSSPSKSDLRRLVTTRSNKPVQIKSRRPIKSTSDTESELMTRVRGLTDLLDTNFKALVEVHDQLVSSQAHARTRRDVDSDAAIQLIATRLTSLRDNLVSVVNRNRRLWRGRMRAKSTRSENTNSKKIDVTLESPTCSLKQFTSNTKVLSGAGDAVEECGGDDTVEECVDDVFEEHVGCDVSEERGPDGSEEHVGDVKKECGDVKKPVGGDVSEECGGGDVGEERGGGDVGEKRGVGDVGEECGGGDVGEERGGGDVGVERGGSDVGEERGGGDVGEERGGGDVGEERGVGGIGEERGGGDVGEERGPVGDVGEERGGGDVGEEYGGGDEHGNVSSGDNLLVTVSREDYEKLNNAMRIIRELESNLPSALTAWSNLKFEHSSINDT